MSISNNHIQTYIKNAGNFDGILEIPKNDRIVQPMADACKVAVVIPVHNEESTIIATLTSLIHQVDRQTKPLHIDLFEAIIVNNNSTDKTVTLVEKFIEQYREKIHIFLVNEPRIGVSSARKRGFDEVVLRYVQRDIDKEMYILSADADNTIDSNWIDLYIQGFETNSHDMLLGDSISDLKILQDFPNICSFLEYKHKIEKTIKGIYIGRAEGNNFGIRLSAYTASGGIKQMYYCIGENFYQEAGDDWNFSAELSLKGFKLGRSTAKMILNPRKLLKSAGKFIEGDIYLADWEKTAGKDDQIRDITNIELHIMKEQQIRGIIAYQMLLSICTNPKLLETNASKHFLGSSLTDALTGFISETKSLFPFIKYNTFYSFYIQSWFMYFKFGELLCGCLSKVFTNDIPEFSYPDVLSSKLKTTRYEWEMDNLIYAYLIENYSKFSKYFGGYF